MPRCSTSPKRTRSSPLVVVPSASRNVRGSASARNDVCRSRTSGPSQRGGPWISGIIVMPSALIRAYRSSMSSTRGVRWLMCVAGTPPMSAATAEIASRWSYQARSIGSVDSAKDAVASSRNRSASAAVSPPSATDRSARASASGAKSSRAATNASSRSWVAASKNRRSSVTSIEVKTRNGLRASSSVSVGRKAVDTTGTELEEASRRS